MLIFLPLHNRYFNESLILLLGFNYEHIQKLYLIRLNIFNLEMLAKLSVFNNKLAKFM